MDLYLWLVKAEGRWELGVLLLARVGEWLSERESAIETEGMSGEQCRVREHE